MKKLNYDLFGIFNSLICLVHCLWLPLLSTTVSSFIGGYIHTIWIDLFFILMAVWISFHSIYKQYKKHKKIVPFFTFIFGFGLLITHSFFQEKNILLITSAFILIVLSHIMNLFMFKKPKSLENNNAHQ